MHVERRGQGARLDLMLDQREAPARVHTPEHVSVAERREIGALAIIGTDDSHC
jgi:hypothetical protein